METDIIDKVKSYLTLQGDYDILTLVKLLTKARHEAHPDRYSEEEKEEMTEKFKEINNLLSELKKYAEQQCNTMLIKVGETENCSLELIKTIGNLADANDKISELEKKIEQLTSMEDFYKNETERLKKQTREDIYKEDSENIASSLQNIYKQSNKNKIWSGASFISIFIMQIKEVKAFLTDVFGNEKIVMTGIGIWASLSLFFILYKSLLKIRITHYQNKLINSIYLNKELILCEDVITSRNSLFLPESNVINYVFNSLTRVDKLLFFCNKEEIVQQLTNYVILQLNKKKIIRSATPNGMELIFEINKNNKYSTNF